MDDADREYVVMLINERDAHLRTLMNERDRLYAERDRLKSEALELALSTVSSHRTYGQWLVSAAIAAVAAGIVSMGIG